MAGLPSSSGVVVQLLPAAPGERRLPGYSLLSISLLLFKGFAKRKRRLAYGFNMKAIDMVEGWQYAKT